MIKNKFAIMLTLGGLAALAPFSIDMYLPAFPQIAHNLHTDIPHLGFTLTSYFIGISFGQLLYGPVTDKFGRRKPLVISLILFVITCIGCPLSPSIEWLVAMRFMMALGGCAAMVTGTAAVRDIFPTPEVPKIFSILMLILGIGPVLAPTFGGAVLSLFNWQSIFYCLAGLSVILIILVEVYLPENSNKNREPLSLKKILGDYRIVAKQPGFLLYALAGSAGLAGMFAYISGSPFVFIKFYGFSEVQYSIIFACNALGFIIGSQLNRWLLNRYKPSGLVYVPGLLMLIVSLAGSLLQQQGYLTAPLLIAFIFLFLLGLGMLVPNCTGLAMSMSGTHGGVAAAVLGALQMSFSAISSSMVSLLADGTLRPLTLGLLIPSSICGIMLLRLRQHAGK